MVASPTDEEDLRAEVAELARALRAQLEWHGVAGSEGVPRDREPPWGSGPEWQGATSIAAPGTPPSGRERPSSDQRVRGAVDIGASRSSGASAPPDPPPPSTPSVVVSEARSRPTPTPGSSPPSKQSAVVSGGELAASLEALARHVRDCQRCVLHEQRKQAVFSRGTGSCGLCFVGEGPGADEDAQGEPFVGKAGQLLDRMIGAMGLGRDEVYVCNIVKCRPPKNRKPSPDEMAACTPYLKQQLELLKPSVIVALGATAMEGLLGISGGITRLRGNWKLYGGTIAVMPTFHPAYLLRNPSAKKQVWEDLQSVLRHMGRPIPTRR